MRQCMKDLRENVSMAVQRGNATQLIVASKVDGAASGVV
jgi:hypothetical protein